MKKIVVKVGSSIIAPSGKLNPKIIFNIVSDIINTEKLGYKIILVSSGAIACGANCLGLKKRPQDAHSLMAIASLGQIVLMEAYQAAFKKRDKLCAQILLTWEDFEDRKRFLNARSTLDKLLNMNVIPIINENDAISNDEIKFGDNDRLAALVNDLVGAEKIIILSDVEGLLDEKGVVKTGTKMHADLYKLVKNKEGQFTSGGMAAKLKAAEIVASTGSTIHIASGSECGIIESIAKGEQKGTCILPAAKIEKARKRWIALSKKIKGKIWIDDGAKDAILNKGKSLLCVGIIKTEHEFKRGDSVEVLDTNGNILGCGLVHYSWHDLVGCRNKKFAKEAIHRDNFVRKD
jgi:glutamate 5-kinase